MNRAVDFAYFFSWVQSLQVCTLCFSKSDDTFSPVAQHSRTAWMFLTKFACLLVCLFVNMITWGSIGAVYKDLN